MRPLGVLALLAAASAALAGCASAASAMPAQGLVADRALEVWGDVQRLEFGKQVQIRLPARLVVADRGFGEFEAQRLEALVEGLEEDDVTWTDVASLDAAAQPGTAHRPYSLEDMRAAASRLQADLLLVAVRDEDLVEGHNVAAVLKILLLPMLFVPTEEDDLSLGVRAAVIDVRNGLVYATFEDHREAEVTSSVAGEDDAVEEAWRALWKDSVARMRERLGRKLAARERTQ
jgi:hypothetical protein